MEERGKWEREVNRKGMKIGEGGEWKREENERGRLMG